MSADEFLEQSPRASRFSWWDRDAYRRRVGEEEAVRRRGAIIAGQQDYQSAGQPGHGGGKTR